MANKKKTKVIDAKVSTGEYSVLLTTRFGKEVEMTTDSLEKAFDNFKPISITGKVIVNVSRIGKSVNRILFAPMARRTFFNNYALKLFIRNIERSLL